MFRERIPARQLSAWLFAGMTPVLIHLLCGGSWLWIGIAGAVSVALTLLVWSSGREPAKWQCPFLFIYIVLLLGQLLFRTAESWPVGDNDPWVSLILLAIAAWSAQKGPSAAARVGAVLFWAVLILYLTVFGAGAKDVELSWLRPEWQMPDELGLVLYLVPTASVCLLDGETKRGARILLPAVFTLAAALITVGVMSPGIAAETPNAFYEMTRSINLLGVARRFEALISAGMTVGWFALMSLLLTICGVLAQKIFPGRGRAAVWLAAGTAAAIKLCGMHISAFVLLIVGTVFWVAIPVLTQGLGKRKKS